MTNHELFAAAYRRTVAAFNPPDDPQHPAECWRAVQGFAGSLFSRAADLLNSRSRYLPRPSEWVEACTEARASEEAAARRERDALAESYANGRAYHCTACKDRGKELDLRCTPDALCPSCTRRGSHPYDHTWCRSCSCRDTNPVYRRYLETLQAAAQGHQLPSRGRSRREAA